MMMKVKTVKIDDIKPYPNNPRQNDGEAIDQVADSIKTFGWQQPIVVDKDMVIIVGETHYKPASYWRDLTMFPQQFDYYEPGHCETYHRVVQ